MAMSEKEVQEKLNEEWYNKAAQFDREHEPNSNLENRMVPVGKFLPKALNAHLLVSMGQLSGYALHEFLETQAAKIDALEKQNTELRNSLKQQRIEQRENNEQLQKQIAELSVQNTLINDRLHKLTEAFVKVMENADAHMAPPQEPSVLVDEALIKKAVVQIKVHTQAYDPLQPWLPPTAAPFPSTGSGVVVDKKKRWIITNDHVVGFPQVLRVLLDGNEYTAQHLISDPAIDLALLTVEDNAFWDKVEALELDPSFIQDKKDVVLAGYPSGLSACSFSKGNVACIQETIYAHSHYPFLAIHITAPTNFGNSGGPILYENRIIGIVHQITSAQNINHAIPGFMVNIFLKCAAKALAEGVPYQSHFNPFIARFQPVKNPRAKVDGGLTNPETLKTFQAYFPKANVMSGVRITRIPLHSPLSTHLIRDDIVLSVGGYPIEQDGKVSVQGIRFLFRSLFHTELLGQETELLILRDQKLLKAIIPLAEISRGSLNDALIPMGITSMPPSFYALSGVIFQPLTKELLDSASRLTEDLSHDIDAYQNGVSKQHDAEQRVIIGPILQCKYTSDYDGCAFSPVSTVNGKLIDSMSSLISAIEGNEKNSHTIELENGWQVVLEKIDLKTHLTLLKSLGVGKLCSPDLMAHSKHAHLIEVLDSPRPSSSFLWQSSAKALHFRDDSPRPNCKPSIDAPVVPVLALDEDLKEDAETKTVCTP